MAFSRVAAQNAARLSPGRRHSMQQTIPQGGSTVCSKPFPRVAAQYAKHPPGWQRSMQSIPQGGSTVCSKPFPRVAAQYAANHSPGWQHSMQQTIPQGGSTVCSKPSFFRAAAQYAHLGKGHFPLSLSSSIYVPSTCLHLCRRDETASLVIEPSSPVPSC